MPKGSAARSGYQYDVCLSFAGEDRDYVEAVAGELVGRGVRVFYDKYEQAGLWGKDLYDHLDDVYGSAANYCVLFVSRYYAERVWTNHERQSAQARALRENREYILPARFDDTKVPGLRETVGFIDLRKLAPADVAGLIHEKLGTHQREQYIPPEPDKLYEALHVKAARTKGCIHKHVYQFMDVLKRMNRDERHAVFCLLLHGCPAELPANVHISADFLRRLTGFSIPKLKRLLCGLRSLGITCSIRDGDEDHEGDDMLVWKWDTLQSGMEWRPTAVVYNMIRQGASGYCEEHALEALHRLDFGQIGTVTETDDFHE